MFFFLSQPSHKIEFLRFMCNYIVANVKIQLNSWLIPQRRCIIHLQWKFQPFFFISNSLSFFCYGLWTHSVYIHGNCVIMSNLFEQFFMRFIIFWSQERERKRIETRWREIPLFFILIHSMTNFYFEIFLLISYLCAADW